MDDLSRQSRIQLYVKVNVDLYTAVVIQTTSMTYYTDSSVIWGCMELYYSRVENLSSIDC